MNAYMCFDQTSRAISQEVAIMRPGTELCMVQTSSGVRPREDHVHPVVRNAREDLLKTSLLAGDVTKSPRLMAHFQHYRLKDYFDEHGQRRYLNLSMSVAAKHNPDIGTSFGSISMKEPGSEGKKSHHLSAHAYRMATETIQKDREAIRLRNTQQYQSLAEEEKMQLQEVRRRQQEMLFFEMPSCEQCLPKGCSMQQILPPEVSRHQEREDRKRFEKLNKDLVDPSFQTIHHVSQQGWFLDYEQIQELIKSVNTWLSATGTPPTLGIDRSTFCQFVLDLDLVDQERISFSWILSLFDHYAKNVRISSSDCEWTDPNFEGRIPVMSTICKWDLITVLDLVVPRRWDRGAADQFMERLRAMHRVLAAEWQRQQDAEDSKPESPADQQRSNRPFRRANKEDTRATRRQLLTQAEQARLMGTVANKEPVPGAGQPGPCDGKNAVWKRNRLITGMLCEPEVLCLVEQYRTLFKEIFDCYADGSDDPAKTGTVEFVDVLQFCIDFRLVPRIASRHEVLRAFRATECLDPYELPTESRGLSRSPSLMSDLESCLGDAVSKDRSGMRARQVSGSNAGSSKERSQNARRALNRMQSALGGNLTAALLGEVSTQQAPDLLEGPKKSANSFLSAESTMLSDPPKVIYRHGLSAFVETLFRLGFGYLLVYGNNVQLATSSRAKTAWLIAYLHGVYASLCGSHGRRLESRSMDVDDFMAMPSTSSGQQHSVAMEENMDGCWMASSGQAPSPSPVPTGSGLGVSKQLTKVLERLGPFAFLEVDPIQMTRQISPAESAPDSEAPQDIEAQPSAMSARCTSRSQAATQRATSKAMRSEPSVLRPEILSFMPRMHSNDSDEADDKPPEDPPPDRPGTACSSATVETKVSTAVPVSPRSTKRNKSMFHRGHSVSGQPKASMLGPRFSHSGHMTMSRLPVFANDPRALRDNFKFSDVLFSRLLRHPSSSSSFDAKSLVAEKAPTIAEETLATALEQANAPILEEEIRRPATVPATSRPSGGRRLVYNLDCEREELAQGLNVVGGRIERCDLTPPPLNPFATQLNERLEKMLTKH